MIILFNIFNKRIFFFNLFFFFLFTFKLNLKTLSSFLLFRYGKMKKRYPILGKTKKASFYYWALFSYRLLRSFKSSKSKFFGFKFTQFYFLPSLFNLTSKKSTLYNILIKKKLGFIKKKNDIRKSILFRAGSYAWKRFIFRRKLYKHFYKFKMDNLSYSKSPVKLNLNLNIVSKKTKFRLKSMYSKKIKRIKRPVNVKHKFNRLFYINRKIFQNLLGYTNLRQNKFNNYFQHVFKKNYKSLIKSFNLTVINVLIRSRFAFTVDQARFLINNNLVFLNGVNVTNFYTIVNNNDVLQLILHKSYFFFFKRILSNIRLLKKKTGYRVWRLTRFLFNFYKQSASNIPSWVDKLIYQKSDVPKFLEVDYTILTTIVLYQPKYLYETDFYTFKYINYFLLRLYTWKYII